MTTATKEKSPVARQGNEAQSSPHVSSTPILPAKPARVKRVSTYNPNPREQPDGTWTCDSERYGGFLLYVLYVDSDGGIHCNCDAGRWDRPCKHGRALHAQLHPPAIAEPATPRMPQLDWFTCPRCGTVAWMPADWECSCKPKPRAVDLGNGWSFTPAAPELSEAMGW